MMLQNASDHFVKQDWQLWEKEILHAESCQLTFPESMDILGAWQPSNDHESCSVNENSHLTPLEDWIQMAIDLEEK